MTWKDDAVADASRRRRDSYCGIVEHAVLLGAPLRGISDGCEQNRWKRASRVVAGRLVNAYSTNDFMLAIMFRSQSWSTKVAGIAPTNLPGFVVDMDVSDDVPAHAAYPAKIKDLLRKIDLDDPAKDAPPPKGTPDTAA